MNKRHRARFISSLISLLRGCHCHIPFPTVRLVCPEVGCVLLPPSYSTLLINKLNVPQPSRGLNIHWRSLGELFKNTDTQTLPPWFNWSEGKGSEYLVFLKRSPRWSECVARLKTTSSCSAWYQVSSFLWKILGSWSCPKSSLIIQFRLTNHKIVLLVSIGRFLLLSFSVFRIQEKKRQVLFISTAKPNNHLAKYLILIHLLWRI